MKSLLLLVCGVLTLDGFVLRQDKTQEAKGQEISVQETSAQETEGQEGKAVGKETHVVRLISDLTKEAEDAKVLVKDVVLDLETGHAALQVVSWRHTEDGKIVIAVAPFSTKMDVKRATKLAKELSLTEPTVLTRQLAAALHAAFGQEMYWSKFIKRPRSDSETKFDAEKYELVLFSKLKGKQVVDSADAALGNISDIGLNEVGEIAYCVLESSDGGMRAIPLGAFLDRERDKNWKIELKQEQVFQFKSFELQKPPQEIDRGWQEYVAVRYGRDTLQEVPKVESK